MAIAEIQKVCGNCRLFEVVKVPSAQEQERTRGVLESIDYKSLNEAEKIAYNRMKIIANNPGIKLGRRMYECERERRAVLSTASCDHPDKYSPLV